MWFEFLHGFRDPVVFLILPGKKKVQNTTQEMETNKPLDSLIIIGRGVITNRTL